MIKQTLIVCALALPLQTAHRPILQSPSELSHRLIEWLYRNDPYVKHDRDRVLFMEHRRMTVVESFHLGLVDAREDKLPFRSEAFTVVVKLRRGLDRAVLHEINRVLEWGGFLILLEDIYEALLYEFNFFKVPITVGPFHIYQKAGTKPTGKRHPIYYEKAVWCSA